MESVELSQWLRSKAFVVNLKQIFKINVQQFFKEKRDVYNVLLSMLLVVSLIFHYF